MPGRTHQTWTAALALSLLAPLSGCALVPRSRLDQCHKYSKALQAEVVQLRDQTGMLRAKNEDLIERAQTDQKRLTGLEDIVARQENSLDALREDRERLANELERVLRVVRVPGGDSTAWADRLDTFAQRHPGVVHEAGSSVCVVPLARLFAPGSDELSPLGQDWLRDFTNLLDGPQRDTTTIQLVAGPVDEVVRTSHTEGPAQRVRAWLIDSGRLDKAAVVVTGDSESTAPPGSIVVRIAGRGVD